ncbi:MAG: F0F1 ATP synthase subunit delta [Proteobacteria bacterium]|nr:F0F1 ATP synthase subunit delta [Pseudomonadota bacterium]MCL2309119.1 F0F1 ATP synthase subunit delta [Pseudomonadota bacterium]
MAERLTVARPYAEAVFALAAEEKRLPHWQSALALLRAVSEAPKVRELLNNPKTDVAAKMKMFAEVCGDALDAGGKRLAEVLLRAGRIGLMAEIETLFLQRKEAAEGTVEATIETALPLDATQENEIRAALAKHTGRKVDAQISVNPALIGGTRITVGDTVIDASVQGRLAVMARELHA